MQLASGLRYGENPHQPAAFYTDRRGCYQHHSCCRRLSPLPAPACVRGAPPSLPGSRSGTRNQPSSCLSHASTWGFLTQICRTMNGMPIATLT